MIHHLPTDRIVIISDTHLGRARAAARSADALRPLWAGAAHLIVNGDVAEVHHPDHWSDAARQTMQLHDLCEADGVSLTLLSGNHDPYISDIRHLNLAEHRVFVTHGDVLHPAVAPWSPVAGRIRAAYETAMQSLHGEERDQLERRLTAAQHAAAHVELSQLSREARRSSILGMLMRPWAVVRVLWYWHVFPRIAARFMAEHAPRATFGIFGHTHHPGLWHKSKRVIINTGSFGFPGSPMAVVLENEQLSVWPIVLNAKRYALDDAPRATFDLTAVGAVASTIDSENAPRQRPAEQP